MNVYPRITKIEFPIVSDSEQVLISFQLNERDHSTYYMVEINKTYPSMRFSKELTWKMVSKFGRNAINVPLYRQLKKRCDAAREFLCSIDKIDKLDIEVQQRAA